MEVEYFHSRRGFEVLRPRFPCLKVRPTDPNDILKHTLVDGSVHCWCEKFSRTLSSLLMTFGFVTAIVHQRCLQLLVPRSRSAGKQSESGSNNPNYDSESSIESARPVALSGMRDKITVPVNPVTRVKTNSRFGGRWKFKEERGGLLLGDQGQVEVLLLGELSQLGQLLIIYITAVPIKVNPKKATGINIHGNIKDVHPVKMREGYKKNKTNQNRGKTIATNEEDSDDDFDFVSLNIRKQIMINRSLEERVEEGLEESDARK
ncbi:hypothetical protein LXL04_033145 [Taraxacum kok-saghyz]